MEESSVLTTIQQNRVTSRTSQKRLVSTVEWQRYTDKNQWKWAVSTFYTVYGSGDHLKRQTRATYNCQAAGQSPWARASAAAWAKCQPCLWRTAPLRRRLRCYIGAERLPFSIGQGLGLQQLRTKKTQKKF